MIEVRAGQGTDEREAARRSSRETEQWSTDKDRSEACKDAKSPTNCTEIVFSRPWEMCGHLKG